MPPNFGSIVEVSMALRAQAPESWEQFVAAMTSYSAQVLAETLRAPPELIVRAQGMAIQANEIAGILRDAPKMYEQAQAAMLAKARAPNNGRQQQRPAGGFTLP